MTTIAYRAGVLAADTGMTVGGSRLGSIVKIARREDGALAGAAGNAWYSAAFLAWFLGGASGAPPEAKLDQSNIDRGVIFLADGTIEVFEPGGSFKLTAPYFAFGAGRPEALGAMHAGASAVGAVQAAIEHDEHTFGDITVLLHEQALGLKEQQLQAAE